MFEKFLNGTRSILFFWLLITIGAGCTQIPDGLKPVHSFDVDRYQGRWFEIMRLDHSFERGLSHVTATYGLRSDGTLSVFNRGLNKSRCRWEEATGTAKFQGDKTVGSLSVSFFWPFSGGYHIIELDETNYNYALVAGPSREYLWVLSRKRTLQPKVVSMLLASAKRSGFPVNELIAVDHREHKCEVVSPDK